VSDGRPPRGPFPSEPEVHVDTEPAPAPPAVRVPIIPPPPRVPREPFRALDGGRSERTPAPPRMPTLGLIQSDIAKILATQRKMAVQLDGFGTTVNSRFDLFHEELALLRATVTQDHAPRITRIERAKQFAHGGARAAVATLAGGILAELWPQYEALIKRAIGVFLP
jgi:hypothetical protein